MNSIELPKKYVFAFNCCHQGASHRKVNKICQDASYSFSRKNSAYAMAIISDGHGGNNYFRSDRGAKMAVNSAKEAIQGFMENFKKGASIKLYDQLFRSPDAFMRQLETNILYRWRKMIEQDYHDNPFTDEEKDLMSKEGREKYESNPDKLFKKAYGATLIAVLVFSDNFWFGLHIGDGKCIAQNSNGTFSQPIPWDDKCFLNVTTSLCDNNPLEEFRHCFHTSNFPSAIFVASDGVDDSFANDDDLYGFYQEIIHTFRTKEFKQAFQEVNDFLPVLSQQGSGDDISISGIITSVS